MSGMFIVSARALAALGSGLLGGYIVAFSDVTQGLNRLQPAEGIAAMQPLIDVVMENALFFIVFAGTPLLAAALSVPALRNIGQLDSVAVLAGAALLVAGVFGVTAIIHVPLNDALVALDPGTPAASSFWPDFVNDWSKWNHVRAVAAVGAAIAFLIALMYPGQKGSEVAETPPR